MKAYQKYLLKQTLKPFKKMAHKNIFVRTWRKLFVKSDHFFEVDKEINIDKYSRYDSNQLVGKYRLFPGDQIRKTAKGVLIKKGKNSLMLQENVTIELMCTHYESVDDLFRNIIKMNYEN